MRFATFFIAAGLSGCGPKVTETPTATSVNAGSPVKRSSSKKPEGQIRHSGSGSSASLSPAGGSGAARPVNMGANDGEGPVVGDLPGEIDVVRPAPVVVAPEVAATERPPLTAEQTAVFDSTRQQLYPFLAHENVNLEAMADVVARSDEAFRASYYTVAIFHHDIEFWRRINLTSGLMRQEFGERWVASREGIRRLIDQVPRPRLIERPFDVSDFGERGLAREGAEAALAGNADAFPDVTEEDRATLRVTDTKYKVAFLHASEMCQTPEQGRLVLGALHASGAAAVAAFHAVAADPDRGMEAANARLEEAIDELGWLYMYLRSRRNDPEQQADPVELGLGNFNSRDFSHIVAIPDVHGDDEFFIRSLWKAFVEVEPHGRRMPLKEFDTALRAVAARVDLGNEDPTAGINGVIPLSTLGRRVALVQLGDIPDRGLHSLDCYKILASIEKVIGWKTIQLLGNHESHLMLEAPTGNAWGHTKAEDKANYGGEDAFRATYTVGGALHSFIARTDRLMVRIGEPMAADAYEPDAAKGDTLFVHGGVDPAWLLFAINGQYPAELGEVERMLAENSQVGIVDRIAPPIGWDAVILDINQRTQDVLSRVLQRGEFFEATGAPIETKRYARDGAVVEYPHLCQEVQGVMRKLHVSRIVVGHTVQNDFRVHSLCGGTFIAADVQMSRGFVSAAGVHERGQPVALVMGLENGRLISQIAHYTHNTFRAHHDSVAINAP